MKISHRAFLVFCFLSCTLSVNVLFWNLRTFGLHRASANNGIQLSQITSGYDILMFAEIKDANCTGEIMCPLKMFFRTYFPEYNLYLSPPLHYCDGRHSGAEEYAILIKNTIPYEPLHYEDTECLFIRPPHGIRIKESQELVLLVFHSNPGNKRELVALEKVFDSFGQDHIVLMGDLNTGCKYVSFEELSSYGIGQKFHWKLSKDIYTNLEKSCPYDRIVSTKDMERHVNNAKVLNNDAEAERIQSDHYPIQCEIY